MNPTFDRRKMISYLGSAEKLIPSTRDQFDHMASRSRVLGRDQYKRAIQPLPSTRDRGLSLGVYFCTLLSTFQNKQSILNFSPVPMEWVDV